MATETLPKTDFQPDYAEIVRFLVLPYLETPDDLRIDCEVYASGKVWVRLAFAPTDKGRVFGRGGRTIQAMRVIVEAAGKMVQQSVHLEVFGARESQPSGGGPRRGGPRRGGPRRNGPPRRPS